MKRLTAFFVSFLFLTTVYSQAPQGFNYQAIARDSQGNLLQDQDLDIRITIYSDDSPVWSENHLVTSNNMGLFALVIGDSDISGSGSAGSFDQIEWGSGLMAIGIEVDNGAGFIDMGMTPFQSVPYALFAANGPGGIDQDLSVSGSILTLSDDPTPEGIDLGGLISSGSGWNKNQDSISTFNFVGIGTDNANRTSLAVQGLNNEPEIPLFEVRREDGVPVFAVFNDGVMVYVDEAQKGSKGGFAVGGYNTATKGYTNEYLRVTPDSVRIYVPEQTQTKGAKGGFAVGGYNKTSKGISHDLLFITPDSIRMYVPNKENDPGHVGLQGGFAIETFDPNAVEPQPREYIMGMNRGITRFNTADNKQGFAIGSQGEGWASTYMQVTPVNTFVGFESGVNTRNDPDAWNASQGSMNLFLGYKSGQSNKYGHHNVFMGYQSGLQMVGDSLDDFNSAHNVFIGPASGRSLSDGHTNIFLGSFAGSDASSSFNNIFIGEYAGSQTEGGNGNIAIGNYAGQQLQSSNNVIIGEWAGSNNTNGFGNVILGPYAGTNSYGDRNVFIGNYAGNNEDGSDKLYIENSSSSTPLIYGDFSNDLLRFNAEVGINTIPGDNRLKVVETRVSHWPAAISGLNESNNNGTGIGVEGTGGWVGVRGNSNISGSGYRNGLYGYASGGEYNYGVFGYAWGGTAYAVYASGNLAYTGSLVSASDQKFKEDIKSINSVMKNLMKVQARSYNVIGTEETKAFGLQSRSQYGFVAQELEQIFPELVVEVVHPGNSDPKSNEKGKQEIQTYKGVKYIEMIPILLKGMQEQQEEIEILKQRIQELEGR